MSIGHFLLRTVDARKQHFLIRATMTFDGRPLTLYEEVHDIKTKEKYATHKQFLSTLKTLLPKKSKPIIVTDAGFKTPWIDLVKEMGWDYVGRVRRPRKFYNEQTQSWRCISALFPQSSSKPKALTLALRQSDPQLSRLVLYKGKPRGRHSLNRDGSTKLSKTSLTAANGAKEPWLLISSLSKNRSFAKKSVQVYQTRVQIEESFRDMKSTKFGMGFEHNHTYKLKRMSLLVMMTTLAEMVLILLGKVVEQAGLSHRFQSNSIRHRRVLSFSYLGKRAISVGLSITSQQWREGTKQFTNTLREASSILT